MLTDPGAKKQKLLACRHKPAKRCKNRMCRTCCLNRPIDAKRCSSHRWPPIFGVECSCGQQFSDRCALKLCTKCCRKRPFKAEICQWHVWPPPLDKLPNGPKLSKINISKLLFTRSLGLAVPKHVLTTVDKIKEKEKPCQIENCSTIVLWQYTTSAKGCAFDEIYAEEGDQCEKCNRMVCWDHFWPTYIEINHWLTNRNGGFCHDCNPVWD